MFERGEEFFIYSILQSLIVNKYLGEAIDVSPNHVSTCRRESVTGENEAGCQKIG